MPFISGYLVEIKTLKHKTHSWRTCLRGLWPFDSREYLLVVLLAFSKTDSSWEVDETHHSPLRPAASNLCLYQGLLAALRQTAIPPTFNTLFISSISKSNSARRCSSAFSGVAWSVSSAVESPWGSGVLGRIGSNPTNRCYLNRAVRRVTVPNS